MSGFPFRLDFACEGVRVEMASRGGVRVARAERFVADAPLTNPFRIDARLIGPLYYRHRIDAQPVSVRWSDMRFDVLWGLKGMQALKVRADGLGLTDANSRIEALTIDIAATGDQAVDIKSDATGLELPPLNQLTGSEMPAALTLAARMDRADVLFLDDLLGSLEDWRVVGGKLHLAALKFQQASMTADAMGVLQLDDVRRLRGSVSVSASNIDDVLKRYGVSPAALSIGSALSGFLARREAPANPAQQGLRFTLPVELKDGRASVGPLRLPLVLLPLY